MQLYIPNPSKILKVMPKKSPNWTVLDTTVLFPYSFLAMASESTAQSAQLQTTPA